MKSVLDLIGEKDALLDKVEQIISNAEKEERKLNDSESTELTNIKKSIAEKDLEIEKLNEDNNSILKIRNNNKTIMENKKFSLLKAINDVANNRTLDERAQAVVNEGIEEMRKAGQSYSGSIVLPVEERSTIQATVEGAGIENVPEDKLNILEPLRAKMVLSQAGANFMTGLSRTVSLLCRAGVDIATIKDQLDSTGVCPSYAARTATKHDTSKGSCCPMAIGNALVDMWKEMQDEIVDAYDADPDEEYDESMIPNDVKMIAENDGRCPECGEPLEHEGGCDICKSCGYSHCG